MRGDVPPVVVTCDCASPLLVWITRGNMGWTARGDTVPGAITCDCASPLLGWIVRDDAACTTCGDVVPGTVTCDCASPFTGCLAIGAPWVSAIGRGPAARMSCPSRGDSAAPPGRRDRLACLDPVSRDMNDRFDGLLESSPESVAFPPDLRLGLLFGSSAKARDL